MLCRMFGQIMSSGFGLKFGFEQVKIMQLFNNILITAYWWATSWYESFMAVINNTLYQYHRHCAQRSLGSKVLDIIMSSVSLTVYIFS